MSHVVSKIRFWWIVFHHSGSTVTVFFRSAFYQLSQTTPVIMQFKIQQLHWNWCEGIRQTSDTTQCNQTLHVHHSNIQRYIQITATVMSVPSIMHTQTPANNRHTYVAITIIAQKLKRSSFRSSLIILLLFHFQFFGWFWYSVTTLWIYCIYDTLKYTRIEDWLVRLNALYSMLCFACLDGYTYAPDVILSVWNETVPLLVAHYLAVFSIQHSLIYNFQCCSVFSANPIHFSIEHTIAFSRFSTVEVTVLM